ncbi:cofactor biosynthesis protein [Thermoplasma volcanium GSS1]|uniref:Cofactor biosynthesis protein n=1 Tax=Thermoplasma volcanium (strain ATCC 51530 / DSM 4299 / JCM 9571 / NBRC 15438 / GSS1) TaxID=273116 RepID=Q97AF8_THEVO|nr:TIGR04053 family radical SAM/SPASM domain-containing protein [Thermoplasma volcanium]BAB59994.1 cofactor biosynthesis protein [Thermoplasma volcanium GSS1]
MMGYNFNEKPLLIFWETTKACGLKCEHCRASAILEALPDEMNYDESIDFLSHIKEFGKPYPIVILTGGDMLRKRRINDIMKYLKDAEIPFSVSPAVTEMLTDERIKSFLEFGVSSVSISLDGMKDVHEKVRGVPGVFDDTVRVVEKLIKEGIPMQINTVVMRSTVNDLPKVLKLILDKSVKVWEVFFLIKTGRGIDREDLSPEEYEDVNKYLLYATGYGIRIRTVESPIFRRITLQSGSTGRIEGGPLYQKLVSETEKIIGKKPSAIAKSVIPTRDGYGIIFVGHNGDVYPSGFLPYKVGNVKNQSIVDIYRKSELLRKIRDPDNLVGKCGFCEYRSVCGGSRARAFAYSSDPFGTDPSCSYMPKSVVSA